MYRLVRSFVVAFLLSSLFSLPAVAQQPVDINQANAAILAEALSGIGESKALAIIAFRQAHGRFASVDELVKVKGIGPALLEKNRARMSVGRVVVGTAKAPAAKKVSQPVKSNSDS